MDVSLAIKNKISYIFLLNFFLILAIPRLYFPDLDHGDDWADADVLNATENFARFGFIKTRFLPVLTPQVEGPIVAYTHYPPLTQIIHGLYKKIFKIHSLYIFRIFGVLFSFLSVLFWYLFIKKFSNSIRISLLASIFYMYNPLFIFGIDALNQMSYADFLLCLILYLILSLSDDLSKKKRFLFLCFLWLCIVAEALLTYEYIIFISLFIILYKSLFKISKDILSFRQILFLLSAPVVGFMIHFFQNAWYFGSFVSAFQDLKNIAIERIGQSKDTSLPINFFTWWKFVISRNFSLVLMFNYYILSIFMICAFLLYLNLPLVRRKNIKRISLLLFILILCGVSWYIIFPSHSIAHTYVLFLGRHLLPVASLFFTLFIYILIIFVNKDRSYIFARLIVVVFAFIIAITGLAKSELPITKFRINKAKDFVIFKECLLRLKNISDTNVTVGVNYFRYPFISYYLQRNCIRIFDRETIERLENLPEYFIFMPYRTQKGQQLYKFLEENYERIFDCKSIRFPSIFFRLRQKNK